MSKNSDKNEVTTEASNREKVNAEKLALLKGVAKSLGIQHSPNIGLDALNKRIEEFSCTIKEANKQAKAKAAAIKKEPTEAELRSEMIRDATKLHRVMVTCNHPNKKDWSGEIFTVSNSILPTIKKYVPFGNPNGWHVPKIILNMMKERQVQRFKRIKTKEGGEKVETYMVPEFNITFMDPLTPKELENLAKKQLAERSIQ